MQSKEARESTRIDANKTNHELTRMDTNLGMKRPLDGEREDRMRIALRRSRNAARDTAQAQTCKDDDFAIVVWRDQAGLRLMPYPCRLRFAVRDA